MRQGQSGTVEQISLNERDVPIIFRDTYQLTGVDTCQLYYAHRRANVSIAIDRFAFRHNLPAHKRQKDLRVGRAQRIDSRAGCLDDEQMVLLIMVKQRNASR